MLSTQQQKQHYTCSHVAFRQNTRVIHFWCRENWHSLAPPYAGHECHDPKSQNFPECISRKLCQICPTETGTSGYDPWSLVPRTSIHNIGCTSEFHCWQDPKEEFIWFAGRIHCHRRSQPAKEESMIMWVISISLKFHSAMEEIRSMLKGSNSLQRVVQFSNTGTIG